MPNVNSIGPGHLLHKEISSWISWTEPKCPDSVTASCFNITPRCISYISSYLVPWSWMEQEQCSWILWMWHLCRQSRIVVGCIILHRCIIRNLMPVITSCMLVMERPGIMSLNLWTGHKCPVFSDPWDVLQEVYKPSPYLNKLPVPLYYSFNIDVIIYQVTSYYLSDN